MSDLGIFGIDKKLFAIFVRSKKVLCYTGEG